MPHVLAASRHRLDCLEERSPAESLARVFDTLDRPGLLRVMHGAIVGLGDILNEAAMERTDKNDARAMLDKIEQCRERLAEINDEDHDKMKNGK